MALRSSVPLAQSRQVWEQLVSVVHWPQPVGTKTRLGRYLGGKAVESVESETLDESVTVD